MAYSDSFPSVRPSFMLSADAGRLDPRCSYTRSTTGSFYGKNKHLSSENLLLDSKTGTGNWTAGYVGGGAAPTVTANHAASPDGTANQATRLQLNLNGNTGTGDYSRYYQNYNVPSGTSATFAVWMKSTDGSSSYTAQIVSPAGSGTAVTVTGTWQQFAVTANSAGNMTYGVRLVGGQTPTNSDTADILIWGANLSTTGQTVLSETTTQIHREYAPTLQTAAINAARFEHSASDGESMGLLVEGSVANVMPYSRNGFNASNAFQYTLQSGVTATESAAVGPSGSLDATLITEDSSTGGHQFQTTETVTSAAHTVSVYVKPVGVPSFGIRITSGSVYGSVFTFADESFTNYGIAPEASRIEPVGNGWYRLSISQTVTSGSSLIRFNLFDAGGSASYVGNGFNGLLVWGFQCEANAFPSSWIDTGTGGSGSTRAADSLSVDLTQAGFNGGPVSIVGEFAPADASVGGSLHAFSLSNSTNDENVRVHLLNSRMRLLTRSGGSTQVDDYSSGTLSDGVAVKFGVSVDTNSALGSADGANTLTATGAIIPDANTRLGISQGYAATNILPANWKRIAIYSEALSDTNLQALTS